MSSSKDPYQGGSSPGRDKGKGKEKEGSPSVGQKIIEKVIKKKKDPKPTLGLRRQPYVRWNTKGLGLITMIENTPADWDGRDDDIDEELVFLSSVSLRQINFN